MNDHSFHSVLNRLRAVAWNEGRGRAGDGIVVSSNDLRQLLEDYDRVDASWRALSHRALLTARMLLPAEDATPPRREFLELAEAHGAYLTGKPDGSEAVTLVFPVQAWRSFDAAMAKLQTEGKTND